MARLILKSPYIKGGAGGYLKYIGTREGVELLPSHYAEYMAKRPRSHGLFGDETAVDMDAVLKELDGYRGNIWTHIISLHREDAARLGYDHAAQWRNLLRTHRNDIAAAMHIQPQDFRWYAAFHDEGDHPHVHMMVWSSKPGEAYLRPQGIEKIKSVLANDIFRDELLHIYEKKSETRDELVQQARAELKQLASVMSTSICDHPTMETMMIRLTEQLRTIRTRKYGYLPKDIKQTVDEIVKALEQIPLVSQCYEKWWQLRHSVESYYHDDNSERPPLSEQKEFRSIKNAVIQTADDILNHKVSFEDADVDWEDAAVVGDDLWYIAQDDTEDMATREAAAEEILRRARFGNAHAQYLAGLLYRDGPVLIPDWTAAKNYFEKAAAQLPEAQYALGKLLLSNDPAVRDVEQGIRYLTFAAGNGSDYAAYRLGKEYAQRHDMDRAEQYFRQSADAGNRFAQYALGKLLLEQGEKEVGLYYLRWSASQGNAYAQFFVDREDDLNPPDVMCGVIRLLYHLSRIFQENATPKSGGGVHIDRKRMAKLRQKKKALGQQDEYDGPTMSM